VFGDVATRDVDERDARVEEDPAGVDVLPEVELLGRVPVVGRPAEPDHHHVLDDFGFAEQRRRDVGRRADGDDVERVVALATAGAFDEILAAGLSTGSDGPSR